jgi:BolA family transcriptional regulator, general stress-responsive regulator
MKINKLINILEQKLNENFKISKLKIEDKSFLHTKHKSFDKKKFHIKLTIKSEELKLIKSIDSNRKIFSILKKEIDNYIHSLQISIN